MKYKELPDGWGKFTSDKLFDFLEGCSIPVEEWGWHEQHLPVGVWEELHSEQASMGLGYHPQTGYYTCWSQGQGSCLGWIQNVPDSPVLSPGTTFLPAQSHLLFKSLLGSRGYGLEYPESDYDYRGVYLLDTEVFLGLSLPDKLSVSRVVPGRIKREYSYWELSHFLRLALKGTPAALECLWAPQEWEEGNNPKEKGILSYLRSRLQVDKKNFLSRELSHAYLGYIQSAWKKFQKSLTPKKGFPAAPDWKSATHSLRLLYQFRELCAEQSMTIKVGSVLVAPGGPPFTSVRQGLISVAEVKKLYAQREAEATKVRNSLPLTTNKSEVEILIRKVRSLSLNSEWL